MQQSYHRPDHQSIKNNSINKDFRWCQIPKNVRSFVKRENHQQLTLRFMEVALHEPTTMMDELLSQTKKDHKVLTTTTSNKDKPVN